MKLAQVNTWDNPVSFIPESGGLSAAAGLHTLLGPDTGNLFVSFDLFVSFLGLSHGKPSKMLGGHLGLRCSLPWPNHHSHIFNTYEDF